MSSCGCCCCGDSNPVQEVQDTLNVWLSAVGAGTPDKVKKLYAPDAVLLPTLAPGVHNTPEKRLGYFEVFTANEDLKGTIDELHTRVFGDVAINSGLYTFTFKKNGQPVSAAARFSFVYKKTAEGWMIVDHHSSLVPAGH